MNILQINVAQGGSTGHIANGIHRRLLRDGENALFLYARGEQPLQSAAMRYTAAFLSRFSGNIGLFCKHETDKILSTISDFCPDVVHLHNLHGYYTNIFRLLTYLREHRIKTVITMHDEFLYTGRCAFPEDCNRWQTGCGNCPRKNYYPAAYFDHSDTLYAQKKAVFDGFENITFVSPSRWLAQRAEKSFLHRHAILTIPNGIETDVFRPHTGCLRERLQIREEKIVLAAAQNLMLTRKGGAYIFELAQKMPSVRFVVVGANYKQYPDNITLLPAVKQATEMASLYAGADAFVITSQGDNFPTVCLESAACGTPVAGFDSGGTKETVASEISRFVPYGDTDALSRALEELFLLNNKEENARFASDAEQMYQQYKTLYFR